MFANPPGAVQVNEDVLHELLLYVGPKEHVAAALVSRLWTLPAQKALYRSIVFHTWNSAPQSSGQRLIEALRNHSHLRALVRQICIHASPAGEDQALDWVDMFPPNSLRNLTYICWPRNAFDIALLKRDVVRTVPHLTASGPMTADGLRACFDLPLMETLELDLSEWETNVRIQSRLSLDASKAPRLKHLYMNVTYFHEPIVNLVLAAFAPQLHSLHIHVSPGKKLTYMIESTQAKWAKDFTAHVCRGQNLTRVVFSGFPNLQTFVILDPASMDPELLAGPTSGSLAGIVSRSGSTQNKLQPFLNELAQRSVVEHLGCIEGLYTEELFQKLPRTMRVLEFYIEEETYPCEGALLDLLGRVQRDGLSLRRVRVFAPEERRDVFRAIEAACKENGVEFEFFPVLPPLHNPPTRPAIVWD
ncbi:hypothetical protein L226DRAFT_37626 [Lentinus tigrinus ALCF2SS1-7]|uniref:F-box domain-containing protein n=1 Tax=Lentinus tigrinus ALCF2SS1-6 TaxID=1328759 RepID=A0A5C2SNH4_9APHY|nr:hypothetical protein L227DRAFT_265992 [Lentinus tigrinus ALCF2SS1-6]RPD82803.1 hypothetical protein L226DRAFT_37626 [Lentinus tigrinus ALCF2SS1-7]